jgi:hypothetical protein
MFKEDIMSIKTTLVVPAQHSKQVKAQELPTTI